MENEISLKEFENFKDSRGDQKGRKGLMNFLIKHIGIHNPIKINVLEKLLMNNGYKGFNLGYLYKVEKDNGYIHKIKKDENDVRCICFYKRE